MKKKRKRTGALVSVKNSRKKFILIDLPHELWVNVAEFLNKPGLATLSFLNKYLAVVAWQTMIRFYRNRFVCFPFSFHEIPAYDIKLLRQLNRVSQFYYTQYYTLFDRAYIELFQAIETKDCQKAINFINRQLSLNQHNVVDRVFYQKNGEGETVISLANRYQLQDFLNFCFNNLILKGYELNKGRYSLVKTGDYSAVLASLDNNMSNEALWLYACAYVCNQMEIKK